MYLLASAISQKIAWLDAEPMLTRSLVEVVIILVLTSTLLLTQVAVFGVLFRKFERSKRVWDEIIIYSFNRPLQLLVLAFGLTYCLDVLAAYFPHILVHKYTIFLRDLSAVVAIIWFMYRFTRDMEAHILNPDRAHVLDKASAFALNRIFRIVIFFAVILGILKLVGVPFSDVLTLGGVGALVLSFAAKDTLGNFFGGLMLYFERPFSVGDYIVLDNKKIEGTVANIGFRSTHLITLSTQPMFVPNSFFSTSAVINKTRMSHRYLNLNLTLRYQDIDKLPLIAADVEKMLAGYPSIDLNKQTPRAYFSAFSQSSVDINITAYSTTTSGADFVRIQQDIYMRLGELVKRHGAEFAFPTQTLEVHTEPAPKE
ncbi:MAG: hypothetical protein COV52_01455 [Gammaproteobacteria bacterium CG11_big_fil_rev_8_21_14_0_20_46_22]|nr:MAG: hypothetical protein COW05_03180 [Gammaproteobacteria bacterium CG12_big_fil_rev_8_21_14_0_65_46_12]PIR11921.1 MAG: hypothetical protein COV52_01455 [Gammaproteobacteria bacterium CG11_big_fil_rev_8_21_14_0_20_46_22]